MPAANENKKAAGKFYEITEKSSAMAILNYKRVTGKGFAESAESLTGAAIRLMKKYLSAPELLITPPASAALVGDFYHEKPLFSVESVFFRAGRCQKKPS